MPSDHSDELQSSRYEKSHFEASIVAARHEESASEASNAAEDREESPSGASNAAPDREDSPSESSDAAPDHEGSPSELSNAATNHHTPPDPEPPRRRIVVAVPALSASQAEEYQELHSEEVERVLEEVVNADGGDLFYQVEFRDGRHDIVSAAAI